MKWEIEPEPKLGDKKIKKCFAWVPVKINNTTVIWLESYIAVSVYTHISKIDCAWVVRERYQKEMK